MSIASELQNYEDGLGDAYDAAQTMGAVMPAQKNMNNLDATILTIPQPTVNNGTLTIQQNGTTLGTFTANQASNTTVNITGGGGSSVTVFYGYIVEGENKHFYSDQAMTTAITAQDFQDAIDDTTQVVVIYDVDGDEQHVVVIGEGGTARVIGDFGDAVYKIQGDSTPSSTNFTITVTHLQRRLTAGSNITISSNTISATDTTYTHFTGATSSADGTQGLVPAPAAGDEGKVLSGAGTWVNQPTVPTVNDGTLTIQHNGTNVQTFTANQSTSATANIQTIYSVDAIDTTAVTPTVTADMIDWSTMRATLWTNPDPTTSYAGTSFTVAGLSNWDYIAVVARTHTSQNQMNIFKVEYANGGIEISFADNGNTMDRAITWSGSTVTVSNGRLNANTANDRCVPVKIIGMMY